MKELTVEEKKSRISILWIIVALALMKADVLALFLPGIHEELKEFAGDTSIEMLMLFGGIMYVIPLAMIFLSKVLNNYKVSKWLNIVAAVITIVYIVGGGSTYPHYFVLAGIEVICMIMIIKIAWKLPTQEKEITE